MEVDHREWRDLEARVMNLEVQYIPVSKSDLEKRWIAVRETMDEYSAKLLGFEGERRKLSAQVFTLQQQNQQAMEMLVAQSVQITDLLTRVHDLEVELEDLREGD